MMVSALESGARTRETGSVARTVFLLFLCWATVVTTGATDWPWRGGIAGKARVSALGGLEVDWGVEAREDGLALSVRRDGLVVEIAARPEAGGRWSWRLARGEGDLAELWPALRGLAGEEAAGWSASGLLALEGQGSWSPEGGPAGEVRVSLRDGWARSETRKLELEGLELDIVTQDLAGGTLPAGQSLRVARLAMGETEARALDLRFGLKSGRVEVASGAVFFLGGRINVRPFAVALASPSVRAVAEVEALQLAEAARLMPWLFAEGRGSLRGRAALEWDEAKGLRVRDGQLDIAAQDGAVLRLAASPGLLTGDMPEFFSVLPERWRWLRWVGFRNPAHRPLREIELGREGLRIETFRVSFWPDGPGKGRTAAIRLEGRPLSGELVDQVVMDINLHGPLTEVMGFGLNQDFGAVKVTVE